MGNAAPQCAAPPRRLPVFQIEGVSTMSDFVRAHDARPWTGRITALALFLAMMGVLGCSDEEPRASHAAPEAGGGPGKERRSVEVPTEEQLAQLPEPSAELAPGDVVKAQLEAMRENDDPFANAGIATAFKHASPSNRAQTGPLERFIRMVKGPAYRPMLLHDRAAYGPVERVGERRARQMVALYRDGEAEPAVYVFLVVQQQAEPVEGFWMTESVQRVSPDAWEKMDKDGVAAIRRSAGSLTDPS
jgi:hypothetical protein